MSSPILYAGLGLLLALLALALFSLLAGLIFLVAFLRGPADGRPTSADSHPFFSLFT